MKPMILEFTGFGKIRVTAMAKATGLHPGTIVHALERWSKKGEVERISKENEIDKLRSELDHLQTLEEMDSFITRRIPGDAHELLTEATLKRDALWLRMLRLAKSRKRIIGLIANVNSRGYHPGQVEYLLNYGIHKLAEFFKKNK